MTENQVLQKQIGGIQISDDPLAQCIVSLTNAMRTDFGSKYKTQFPDVDTLRLYKRRLYSKLKEFEIQDIMNGYELFIDENNEWPPTVPDMLNVIRRAKKERLKAEENMEEAKRVASLPQPKMTVDPLKILAKAKAGNHGGSNEDWLERKAKILQNHEAVLVLHGDRIVKPQIENGKTCAIDFCGKPAGFSSSTKGGENWYCKEHFKTKG